MADISKTVSIIFSSKDDVSKTINNITGSLDKIGQATMSIADPLAAVAGGVLKLDAALVALAGTGLVYAFNKSKDFESATIELQKVIGEEADKLGIAKENALALSDTYGASADKILDSTATFKQAGFNVEEAMTLVKNSMDLAIAGQMEAAEASEYLTSILKGFKAPASDAAQIIDILNEVSNKYATNVIQLSDGMARLSPIAKIMGLSYAETAGYLTPVIEVFRSGEEAGTALRMAFLKLLSDAAPVQDALERLGVSQKDANGAFRSGRDIMADVATAFQTADKNSKLFLASQLVGKRQASKFVQSFGDYNKVVQITAVAMKSAGSAALEVAARLESSQVAVDRFKVGFQNLAIVVGDQFRDSAKAAIDGGTEIEKALQSLVDDGTFKPIFDTLSGVSKDLGEFLNDIAKALPDAFKQVEFDKFLESLGALGGEIGTFFGNLDLTKPDDLAKAIQFVIDSVTSLIDVTTGMVEIWKPVITAIGNAIDAFNNLDAPTKEIAGNILALSQALVIVAVPLAVARGAVSLLIVPLISAAGAATTLSLKLAILATGPYSLAAAALGAGYFAGTLLNKFVPGVSDAAQGLLELIDVNKNYFGALNKTTEQLEIEDKANKKAIEGYKERQKAIEEASKPMLITIDSDPDIENRMAEIRAQVAAGIPEEKETVVTATVDKPKVKEAQKTIKDILKKEMDIRAKIDVANIKAQSEEVKTAIEWNAKLNIADVEANAKIITGLADTIGESFEASGSVMTELFSMIDQSSSSIGKWRITEAIEEQQRMQRAQLELETELTRSQIDLNKKKTDRLDKGDAIIKVDSSGLEPHLEMIIWHLLEKTQIRANEEYSEFLLGV